MDSSVETDTLNLKEKIPISLIKTFTPRFNSSLVNLMEDVKGTTRANEIMNSKSPDNRKRKISIDVTRRSKRLKSHQSSPRKKKVL